MQALLQQWDPSVVVCCSPAAQALCTEENGLTFAEILRPLGRLRQLNGTAGVPVRTSAEHPLRLHSWTLRFYDAATVFQPAQPAADDHLRSVLTSAAAEAGSAEVLEVAELIQQVRAGDDPTPWFAAYCSEFLRMLRFGEHESQDQPVACLLVLPADQQGDLVGAFRELHQQALAGIPLMASGVMDPHMLLHYVLLHDTSHMGPGALEGMPNKLKYLSSALGSNVHLLTINGAAATTTSSSSPRSPGSSPRPGIAPQAWAAHLLPTLPGGGAGEPAERPPVPLRGLGSGLSQSDVDGLSKFVHDMAVRSLIPHMESRIRSLSQQVAATRKGLRNQLRSLLWRKGSASFGAAAASAMGSLLDSPQQQSPQQPSPGTPSAAGSPAGSSAAAAAAPSYLHSSVEAEMRRLADLALMLGDCTTATSTLRLLASDFKGDKAYKHYAGVQEALGAAAVLGGAAPADAVAHFKEALYRYHQLHTRDPRERQGTRYATRVALLLSAYMRSVGLHSEANWVCMKAHYAEDNLRAGLLLEQAAHCLLAPPAPRLRKYAFQMVLAGLRYNMCGQKGLALRAYKQVLPIYSGRGWAFIEEHLHDVLGKQSREAGDLPATVAHFMAMLHCEQNSLHCQRLYLSQFMDALRAAEQQLGYSPVLELPLPAVGLERVGLQYDGQSCFANVEARQVAQEAWRPLEAAVQPAAEGGPTWLDGGSRATLSDKPQHTCCVGEVVGVDVELRNPLQVDLAVTHLRLACSFESTSTAGGGSSSAAAAAAALDQQAAGEGRGMPGSPEGAAAAAAGAQPDGLASPSSSSSSSEIVQRQGGSEGGGARSPSPGFQAREESITLRAGERVVVHLRVVPLRPGTLEVAGVAWTLGGIAQGLQRFQIPRPRPVKSGTSRVMLDAERPPAGGITLSVLPPMPRLDVSVEGLESTVLVGELVQARLRLKNTGAMTLQGLAMAAGGPGIYLASSKAAVGMSSSSSGSIPDSNGLSELARLRLESSAGTSARGGSEAAGGGGVEVTYGRRQGVLTFSLPPKLRLAVGHELVLPIWFRAGKAGQVRFNTVWCYGPLVRLDSLRYRTARSSHSVVALPSLQLTAGALAGAPGMQPGTVLLQLHASNMQGQQSFRLSRLDCPDGCWQLNALQQPPASGTAAALPAAGTAAMPASSSSRRSSSHALDVVLEADSSATLHFSLQPLPAGAPLPSTVQGAELHLYEQGQPSTSVPASQAAAQRQQQRHQLLQEEQGRHRTAAAGRGHAEGALSHPLDLLLHWEAAGKLGGSPRQGYHVLYGQRLRSGPPIHVQLVGPLTPLRHDFSSASFCLVNLTLRLRNTLAEPAAVCIEAGRDSEGRPSSLSLPTWADAPAASPAAAAAVDGGSPTRGVRVAAAGAAQPVQAYVWCGRTRVTLPSVPAGVTVEVPLQVAALVPGRLALADYRVSWQYASAPHLTGSVSGAPCFVLLDAI